MYCDECKDQAHAAIDELEQQVNRLREAQRCASCGGTICPPMQCGPCIEREAPVPGMSARPATTNLRERLDELTKAIMEQRTAKFLSDDWWDASDKVGDLVGHTFKKAHDCSKDHPGQDVIHQRTIVKRSVDCQHKRTRHEPYSDPECLDCGMSLW